MAIMVFWRTSRIWRHSFPVNWKGICIKDKLDQTMIPELRMQQIFPMQNNKSQVDLRKALNKQTLCRTMSKGPWSERGLFWSIATNIIPFFLHQNFQNINNKIKMVNRVFHKLKGGQRANRKCKLTNLLWISGQIRPELI